MSLKWRLQRSGLSLRKPVTRQSPARERGSRRRVASAEKMFPRQRFIVLFVMFAFAAAIPGLANAAEDWQLYTDQVFQVTFSHPKDWKTSPAWNDRTYFEGPDGSVQLDASEGDNPQQICRQAVTHHLRPYGSRPRVRALKVQGQKACLVWPSADQGGPWPWYAELVVEYPRPVEINGYRYKLLVLNADKNHILEIIRTIRFLSFTRP